MPPQAKYQHHLKHLDPMERDCLEHWAKYRPKMCASLEAAGSLVDAVRQACQQTEQAIKELEKQGLSFLEAKNAVQEEWMYLPDERDVPLMGESRDAEEREEDSGGPTELDRNRGALSEALLGSSYYAALCWGCTPKYTISGVRPSSAEWGRPAL